MGFDPRLNYGNCCHTCHDAEKLDAMVAVCRTDAASVLPSGTTYDIFLASAPADLLGSRVDAFTVAWKYPSAPNNKYITLLFRETVGETNTMKKKQCCECKFFMTEDYGYSNYTVMETEVHCLKNANPFFPCDDSYSWKYPAAPEYPQLTVADTCEHFKAGYGMQFDVDGEITVDDYADDQELVSAYDEYQKTR